MLEPTSEEKAVLIMARTALEVALQSAPFRWLFCMMPEGETIPNDSDCACCITWADCKGCQCVCHDRLRLLDRLFDAALRGMMEKDHSWFWNRHIDGTIHQIERADIINAAPDSPVADQTLQAVAEFVALVGDVKRG